MRNENMAWLLEQMKSNEACTKLYNEYVMLCLGGGEEVHLSFDDMIVASLTAVITDITGVIIMKNLLAQIPSSDLTASMDLALTTMGANTLVTLLTVIGLEEAMDIFHARHPDEEGS